MLKPSQHGDEELSANVLPIGTQLGEFEIKGLIGEGGFGIVYLAYDHSLERQVALKEYMPSGLASRTTNMAVSVRSQKKLDTFTAGLKSFINEARMLAQFDSPALVKVHSFWEGNGTAYMVMPYYQGITLKQALQSHKIKPTEGWIRMLLADLCEAIDILHRAHCLHRDIAPDNILLLKDGRPLLLDFGAARRVIGDLTQCFTAILKPGFAPIEQYADIAGLRQGAWTDIYALAAVVYYLMTGKAPPPSVARMVHDELVPAREAGKGRYSDAFLATIDKALSVRPEQRYHSIEELRHALNIKEPEPRTEPYPGGEWATTVARTAPLSDQADKDLPGFPGAFPAKPSAPQAPFDELTRHAGAPGFGEDDITAIAPPMQPARPTQRSDAAALDKTVYGGSAPASFGTPSGSRHAHRPGSVEKTAPASGAIPPSPATQPPVSRSTRHAAASPAQPRPAADGRIEPELLSATQMAGDWHNAPHPTLPPHSHENDAAVPRRKDKQGWLILALLFAVGIGSGIYLGTNHVWDGLSEHAIDGDLQTARPMPPDEASQSSTPRGTTSPDQSVAGASALPSTGGAGSSGSSAPSSSGSGTGTSGSTDETQASLDHLRSEIELWKSASKEDQISSYEHYLREYPQGLYAPIAKLRLERLQAAAAPKSAKSDKSGKPAAPAKPVEQEPAVAGASRPDDAASSALRIKPEEVAWTKATSINSAAAYQEYLRKYPKGGYAALAHDRLASMKLAAAGKASVLPQPDVPIAAPPAARGNSVDSREPQQAGQAGTRQSSGGAPSSTASSGAGSGSAVSSPSAPSPSASGSSAPTSQTAMVSATTPSTTSAPTTSTLSTAAVPASSAPASAAASRSKDSGAPDQVAALTPSPPQTPAKPRESESVADSAASPSTRTIKVADQTMVGDFNVDKKTGLVSGKGKISWANGNQFEGTLVQGSKEGKGRFVWNSGQRYSGDWANDAPNGKGVFLFPDGSRYDGEVRDGQPHGQGTTRFKNGIVYTGDWARGKIHGQGRYIWADGSYWEGEFRNDKKTENGRMYYPDKSAPGTARTTASSTGGDESQRAAAGNTDKDSDEK